MSNALFAVAFGDYDLRLDRRALTYRLEETATGTLWADGLSLGWIELEERASGAIVRHDFGACRLISLSEKMSAQGKRILFGLDAPGGVPIDLYVTCGPKEVQLVAEASRDTKTHRLRALGLLPGILAGCAVAPTRPAMAVAGALRDGSALALLWDSLYARPGEGGLIVEGDPERRRVDVRLIPLPGGDCVAFARAHREKLVHDGVHVTLRKKARRAPALGAFLESDAAPEALTWETLPAGFPGESRWDGRDRLAATPEPVGALLAASGDDETSAPVAHVWTAGITRANWLWWATVYRDSVLAFVEDGDFLTALLSLTRMRGATSEQAALLGDLHRRTFAAFLKAYHVLEGGVEEALYTDGTRVTVNRGDGAWRIS